jgi:hypothetical protein
MAIHVIEHRALGEENREWLSILEKKEQYSFFETPAWAALLQKTLPDAKPCHHWFRFSDEKEAVLPLFSFPTRYLLRKFESLPWGCYGGLISDSVLSAGHYRTVVPRFLSLWSPVLTITVSPFADIDTTNHPNQNVILKQTHVLPLRDAETFWAQIQSRTRTNIQHAKTEGIRIGRANDLATLERVEVLYKKSCERWEGIQTVPPDFFKNLPEVEPEEMGLWIAEKDDRLLSMCVMLYGKNEVNYFIGASDIAYSRMQAPKLLMFEIIQDAIAQGYRQFNFGASGGIEGVERFKRHFGGQGLRYTQTRYMHPILEIVQRLRARFRRTG